MHNYRIFIYRFLIIFLFTLFHFCKFCPSTNAQTFAVIGDYGSGNIAELDVSNLVKSWNPDFIITVGDNNYPTGDSITIDTNIGQFYHEFISPYVGNFGLGDTINRFFPTLGNHDLGVANGQPYFDYFTLPDNERYYDFVWGDIHFFALNSNTSETDGTSSASIQGQWLQNALANSTSIWRIVYFHHAPYSSSTAHGNNPWMQWPFKEWGASVVLAGHDHTYERIIINNFTYFVNGLGGRYTYNFGTPIAGSQVRYNADYGAMLVTANSDSIVFKFFNRADSLIDTYTLDTNFQSGTNNITITKFFLKQSYPNPFSDKITIQYDIHHNVKVNLKIYNISGQVIAVLVNNKLQNTGSYLLNYDLGNLETGIYFMTLQAGNYRKTIKIVKPE